MPEFVAKMGTAEGDVIERVYLSENADALRRDLEIGNVGLAPWDISSRRRREVEFGQRRWRCTCRRSRQCAGVAGNWSLAN